MYIRSEFQSNHLYSWQAGLMALPLQSFITLLASLALVSARDNSKFMKTVPTISNSLVNLGKMEISFYFNGKHQDNLSTYPDQATHDVYFPPTTAEEPCPCNSFKPQVPSILSDPNEIINKILRSNDLFKDPSSSVCCESVEHSKESTVVLEVSPKNIANLAALRNFNNPSTFPKTLRVPPPFNTLTFTNAAAMKDKPIEIFMFPRRKDMSTLEFPVDFLKTKKYDHPSLKPNNRVVEERKLSFKTPSNSVKKDLTLLEKKNKQEITEAPKQELQSETPSIIDVKNTL